MKILILKTYKQKSEFNRLQNKKRYLHNNIYIYTHLLFNNYSTTLQNQQYLIAKLNKLVIVFSF